MYEYFLAIGSNLGDKMKNIDLAIEKIKNLDCKILKIAPFYKTEPLLPDDADDSYNKTFYNTAIKIITNLNPYELLQQTQQIEIDLGRDENHKFWSPRTIDVDILYCQKDGNQIDVFDEKLQIPHKEIFNRAFVLDPLSQIAPMLNINGQNILNEAKKHPNHQAIKMAIVNINNNSFSGDGSLDPILIEDKIKHFVSDRVAIIDIGAESTNPLATQISWQEELERLRKVNIAELINKYKVNGVKFSIDTYHHETADFAIKNGFDIINDVNGFKNEEMWKIMQDNRNIEAVIMHSLEPNGNKNNLIAEDSDLITILSNWVLDVKQTAKKYNINEERIIIDYGIGFGKSAIQDLFIINNVDKINNQGFRVLIGHSRKSFLKLSGAKSLLEKDIMTNEISIELVKKGVDILRVHR